MDNITTIFLDETGTIRSGWRIALFLGAYFLFSIFTAAISLAIFGNRDLGMQMTMAIGSAVVLVPALVVGSLCGKLLEKLPWSAVGVPVTLKGSANLVLGCIVGVATFAFAVAIAMVGGGLSFTQNTEALNGLWLSLLTFGVAAAFEEAFFRGYIFQTLTRSGYAWLAIFITAVPFGVVHLGNPNAGVISTINTILAGVWFGLAYLKTRDLWFVWGLHWFWNWTQASVFGIEVSGLTDFSSTALLVEQDAGPHWLTGTTYGIEGGIACTIAILLSMVALKPWKLFNAAIAKDAENDK
ncbi:MAG TPA: type II CAAX endopeptidase family protein [Pyrinomonadaceae bacterium]|nr:type II CAAX endopeptidase family protein [Pyrinomonadaceae bacterium]